MSNKTIEVFQFAPKYKDLASNAFYILTKIKEADSDIILFPELALSGYFFLDCDTIKNLSLESECDFFNQIQEIATDLKKIICLGFAEKEDDNIYNSAAIFFPDESLSSIYRKSHLFYKESYIFEKGNTGFFVTEYPKWDIKIGLMICYDWRFPEATRTLALQGADIVLCPSNLVTGVWQKVMESRALENKIYMVVANRIGSETNSDETLIFNGESSIIDYNGKVLVKAGADDEISIKSIIDPDRTRDKSFNEINDIFKDRRDELYFTNFD